MQTGLAEARAQILAALGPLFRGMVEKVLPAMARDALVPVIVERLQALAQDLAGQPLSIRIHPGAHDTAAEMLAGFPAAFSLSDDPALGPGQALLALPDRERMIDLDGVIAAIGEAMDAYLHNHGAEAPRQGVIQDA
jgi:flagellar assembly protein FliH